MIAPPPFSLIHSIDSASATTWAGTLFLTLDMDWADDAVLVDTIELLEAHDASATWFITHDTPLLARLRANPKFEMGIHPNFNHLLEGDARNGRTVAEVIDRLMQIVPEATSVRSHSMTQSTRILDAFAAAGLTHDCNHFIPEQSGIALKPWASWNGLQKIPYSWEDDIACIFGALDAFGRALATPGLRVVDFHPIHIYLNTPTMAHYEATRAHHRDGAALLAHRNRDVFGVRDVFLQCLEGN